MPDLATRIKGLTPRQREALFARARTAVGAVPTGAAEPGLLAQPTTDGRARASFVQEQVWLVDKLAAGVPLHNVSFALHLSGRLAEERLCQAVAALIRRHPILTARAELDGGELYLRAAAVDPPKTVLRDLASAPDPARRARARVDALARTRFDLSSGPLVRTELLRLGPDRYILMWVAHHAALDGASFDLLLTQLRALYAGPPDPGPRLATAPYFGDFARWQRERVAGERLDQMVEHWRSRLAGAVPAQLPADRPRPQAARHLGGLARFEIPDHTARGLRSLAADTGATLFSVLLTAFGVMLEQRAGARGLVVGVPMSGRTHAAAEGIVGPFSNTLPVVLEWAAGARLRDAITSVSAALLDAGQYQDMPIPVLVDRLRVSRDAARNPLFQILVNMGNLPGGTAETAFAPGVTLRPEPVPNGTVRVDVEVTFDVAGDRLAGRLEYERDLYDESTARAWVEHLLALLEAVADGADSRVADLPARPLAPAGPGAHAVGTITSG